jgi:hypothetical protein
MREFCPRCKAKMAAKYDSRRKRPQQEPEEPKPQEVETEQVETEGHRFDPWK